MKPHLPISLLIAVLAAFVALPAQAIEAPEGYTTPYLNGDESSDSPVALSFKDDNGTAFSGQDPLTFDTLSNLTFAEIKGDNAAISLANNGSLTITNVTDGLSGTVDVLFEDIMNTSITTFSYGGAIYASGGAVTISHNGDVSFSKNSTYSDEYDSAGGAIYATGGLTISYNGDVSFSINSTSASSSSYGGAIYASSLTISHNDVVSFSGNSVLATYSYSDSGGSAIYATGELAISNNDVVSFSSNYATAYTSCGGAIYAAGGLTISKNDVVSFSGNSTSSSINEYFSSGASCGGAIYADNGLTISYNGDVSFGGNYASYSDTTFSYGGAIYASGGDVTISNNGTVSFSENFASCGGAIYTVGALTVSNNSNVTFSGNYSSSGGAIYAENGLTISDNINVSFSGNTTTYDSFSSDYYGGAIYAKNGFAIRDNGDVSFSGNSAEYGGGAIYATGGLSISHNGDVTFSENSTIAYFGGAIKATGGAVTISENGNVSFTGNTSASEGGAIYASSLTISNNSVVSFMRNSAIDYYSRGGAIYVSSLAISNNDKVSFSGNSVLYNTDISSPARGGAIHASGLTISNNGDVSFTGNFANSHLVAACGGAIYSTGSLNIQGNDSVLFEKNYENEDGEYRLRGIFAGLVNLSAKTGGSITFYDSVYIGDSNFNSDYADANGNTQSAGGDIIFSGKYAAEHLNEILTANNEGRTATAEEILNSQTSTIGGNAYLNGGSLQVKDGAVLSVNGDTVSIADGSNAKLAISDAELVAANATIEVGESATLQLSKGASVTADEISIKAGATLVLGDIAITTSASDSMVAAYRLSSLNIINADLTFAAGSTLVTDGTGINMTEGSILTFMATSEGEKVNLVLTLGAEYTEDSLVQLFSNVDIVKFLMDGEEVDTSLTLRASDFFTGAGINENTTLHYDSTTNAVYLKGVSNVVPEPATATLSLLALAALASRRRRK